MPDQPDTEERVAAALAEWLTARSARRHAPVSTDLHADLERLKHLADERARIDAEDHARIRDLIALAESQTDDVIAARRKQRITDVDTAVLAAVSERPGIGSRELRPAVRATLGRASNDEVMAAAERLKAAGRLRVEPGGGTTPTRHYLGEVNEDA